MTQRPKSTKPEKSSDDDEINIDGDVADSVIITGDGNVINVVEKKTSHSKKHSGQKKTGLSSSTTAIIVAVIGILGTITVALINVYGKESVATPTVFPTAMPVTVVSTDTFTPSPIPTETALPDEPTSTPEHSTDTPIPPSLTPVIPVPLGEDWLAGCISSLWKAYPSSVQTSELGNGCLREPVHVFSAENGDLDFLYQRPNGMAETYGLFAPLPETGSVTFTIRLRELENVDLWMGIFAEPDVNSNGLLMTILNGDVSRRAIVQKDSKTYVTMQGTVALNQGNGYSITFTFDNLSVISRVNPSVFQTNPFSLPGSQKWLFLGYKGLRGAYSIDGTFLNFELKQP
jgi:hypothetical protein